MPSFVLPLTALDPSLIHPISLEFLYEYREPTFGILYSQVAPSSAQVSERKDVVYYAVFTLDLQQRASTTLLSVPRLPSDLLKIVPLPPPVGGALLIGSNELIHVDQGGKTNAVGVNEFARHASAFSMADQSDLGLRLEDCVVEQLGAENGDMVLVLLDGRMAIISFKLDGRSVSGISVKMVPEKAGGMIPKTRAACTASLGKGKFFIGSEEGDSLLMAWSRPSASQKKGRGSLNPNEDVALDLSEGDEEEDDEEEDDLYGDDIYSTPLDAISQGKQSTAINGESSNDYTFRPHDRLWNLGAMRDITLGKCVSPRGKDKKQKSPPISPPVELVGTQGSGRAGGLAILRKEIDPFVVDSLKMEGVDGVWSIQTRGPQPKAPTTASDSRSFDRYLILAKSKLPDKEESVVYSVSEKGLEAVKAPEFNPNEDFTVDVGTLAGGTRIVQVLRSEVRSYDTGEYMSPHLPFGLNLSATLTDFYLDLGLSQIYPVWDEDTSEERTALRASFAEQYLFIIRDDQSMLLLQVDESGDLDEMSLGEGLTSCSWLSGSLYADKHRHFLPLVGDAETPASENVLLFLLDTDLRLLVSGSLLVLTLDG
jgi:cleavage and polyadenylation specificity factor subunit 1